MSEMYARMGLSAVQAVASFGRAKIETRLANLRSQYAETMRGISTAITLNDMTDQEVATRDAGIRAQTAIASASLRDNAAATASAAAAGVGGSSVEGASRSLNRSRLRARHALMRRLEQQRTVAASEKRNVRLGSIMSRGASTIPAPSAAHALLGLTTSLIDIRDSEMPEDRQLIPRG